jgi:hypothetical protein
MASNSLPSSGAPFVVYIVTNIRYPTPQDFDLGKGSFRIDSVHSSRKNANARAKKIIYDGGQVDGGQFKVDVDKIIEETRKGLFAAIGIGGKGERKGVMRANAKLRRRWSMRIVITRSMRRMRGWPRTRSVGREWME